MPFFFLEGIPLFFSVGFATAGTAVFDRFFPFVFFPLLLISSLGILFAIYLFFLKPLLQERRAGLPQGVRVGDQFIYIVDEKARIAEFTIGRLQANLPTLASAISENHLTVVFKKAKDTEDYDIRLERGGPIMYRPPRMDIFSRMESKESFESHEIIGHTTAFRLSDKIVKDRMVNFIEIEMKSDFARNKNGVERMRFLFTIKKIQPGLNREARAKDNSHPWGKEGDETPEASSEEA